MIEPKNLIPIIFLITIITYPSFSQGTSSASVSGKVIDYLSGEPLGFATVVIYDSEAQDSSKMTNAWNTGINADREGLFLIEEVPIGEYFVEVSFMGFKTKRTKKFSIENNSQQIDLKEISIEESIEFLSGVEITAEKTAFNFDIDRKVYNVEEDILSETGSVTEILNNIPSVSVDYNGTVSLRGTSNITYFINGKPSALMRANPTAYLQSIPANSIEHIEVITNPSAKYRPDGAGGIINIVMKGAAEGWEGSVQGSVGNLDRYTGNVALNFSKGDATIFGNYAIRHTTTPQDITDIRTEKDGEGNVLSDFRRETKENYKELSHIANGGLIFPMGENSNMEISGEYFYLDGDNNSTSKTITNDNETGEVSTFTTDRIFKGFEQEYQVDAAFEHEFEKEEHTLAIEAAYGRYDEEEDNYFDENHTNPEVYRSETHNLIAKGGPITELAVEYANPIVGDTEIELGYFGEFLTDNIKNLSENKNAEGIWIVDPNRTNNFDFTQDINAVWAVFSQGIEAFSFAAGLRAEQVNITSKLHQLTTDSIIPNDYFNLYPSLHLTYELGDNEEIQLNYSKRANRADSDEHNPFPEYDDPRTREAGNPLLKPEIIHSFELGYHIQKDNYSFIPSLYYRHKLDAFTEIREIVEDTILQTSIANLDVEKSGGLEFIVTTNIKERVGLNFSANLFYSSLDASNLGYSSNNSQFNWDAKLAASFTITKSTFAQLNAYYRSARQTPQGYFEGVPLLNLGFRQDLFKKKEPQCH